MNPVAPKSPRVVLNSIFAFPPNRDTLGATAYFIVENGGNILIDCPAWNEVNQQFLQEQGGARWLFLTHRTAMAKVAEFQRFLGCEVVVQEQEAYLLPDVTVLSFQDSQSLGDRFLALWTPGYSPGSACLYDAAAGGVLFSGRHLLPNQEGKLSALRTGKTFHWPRQVQSVRRLVEKFSLTTLNYICPGANTGFLRGERLIDKAYERLVELNRDLSHQNLNFASG